MPSRAAILLLRRRAFRPLPAGGPPSPGIAWGFPFTVSCRCRIRSCRSAGRPCAARSRHPPRGHAAVEPLGISGSSFPTLDRDIRVELADERHAARGEVFRSRALERITPLRYPSPSAVTMPMRSMMNSGSCLSSSAPCSLNGANMTFSASSVLVSGFAYIALMPASNFSSVSACRWRTEKS